jgi:oligopeptide/dipeptide ABC transporter ATP-binding protein
MCDRTAIMYLGRIVEMGSTERLIRQPRHPYTQVLLSVVPTPDPERTKSPLPIEGEVPNPIDLPPGCRFHPRCYKAMEICRQAEPPRVEVAPNHIVECHLYQ